MAAKKGPRPMKGMKKAAMETEEEDRFDFEQATHEDLTELTKTLKGEEPNVEQAPSKTMQQQSKRQAVSMPGSMPSKRPVQRKVKGGEYQEESVMKPSFQEQIKRPNLAMYEPMPSSVEASEESVTRMRNELFDSQMQQYQKPMTPFAYPPLPPIINVENFNEIFQYKPQSVSLKGFKDYFVERAKPTSDIECVANALVTDAHLYELSHFDWAHLRTVSIRACPQVTPFGKTYMQMIPQKIPDRVIDMNVELANASLDRMDNESEFMAPVIEKLEKNMGQKSTITPLTKVLIYHANLANNSLLTSEQMLIGQSRKSTKESSPMLLGYSVSTHNGCQVALLECAHSVLFHHLCTSFHPRMIYLLVSSADDFLRCFFTADCNTSFAILHDMEIRLINTKSDSHGPLLSDIQAQLNRISQTAQDLYTKHVDDSTATTSPNDDFRRNHYLSSHLHTKTKCDLLLKKLLPNHFLSIKPNDASFLSNEVVTNAVNFGKPVYKLPGAQNEPRAGDAKIVEAHEPLEKLVAKFIANAKEQSFESTVDEATRIAQIYFSRKLINDVGLDLQMASNGKSYFVSDLDWFCRTINSLFNRDVKLHRKTEHLLQQLKQTIGSQVHLLSGHNMRDCKINEDELNFFVWLFDAWNIAYPVSTDDASNRHMYILFNSISPEPPVPLNTVWSESWSTENYESMTYFRLLHPCDASVLFRLYKLLPSQRISIAAQDFLLIRDGAVEILIRTHHHQNDHATDITLTCRALNLNGTKEDPEQPSQITKLSFDYVVREYFIIVWAFLFKQDYAFKIKRKGLQAEIEFEEMNGNELMIDQWVHLALYHYSSAPTLTSVCSVCGLRPSANKALYDACTVLSPARVTNTEKHRTILEGNENNDRPSALILDLDKTQISFTGKYSLRPDGCNSFEVVFLSKEKTKKKWSSSSARAVIEIGCLMNNFDVKDDEKILFEYGNKQKVKVKRRDFRRNQQPNDQASYLDEIRNFGGMDGLKKVEQASQEKSSFQEIYSGLRLRVDILFTDKPKTFEVVYSVNGVPTSRQVVKRRSAKTMFQPMFRCLRTDESRESMFFVIQHHKSYLDDAIIESPAETNLKKPWKLGMRLEAKDRKNPNIIAIANIIELYEDDRIRINFDGWTSTFDYTVEIDNPDIHPCGYWEYVQRVLHKNVNMSKPIPHMASSSYDKPKSYDRPFSWRNYLTTKDVEPLPFECFSYAQTEGMPVEYFPHSIAKAAFTNRSCRHSYNTRVKYHKMNTFIQNEIVNRLLSEHSFHDAIIASQSSPGVVLLPTPFDSRSILYPCLKQFQNPAGSVVHISCNHRDVSPLDSSTIISGAHLLDSAGSLVGKSDLDMSVVTLCMLTAVDLARNQKHPIAPCTSKFFSDQVTSVEKHRLESYIRRWLDLSAYIACFHSIDFYAKTPTSCSSSKFTDALYTSYSDQDLYVILKNNLNAITLKYSTSTEFGVHGECFYCTLLRRDDTRRRYDRPIGNRLETVGDYAPSIFYLQLDGQDKQSIADALTLNDEFFLKFNGLEIIDIKDVTISRFQLNETHMDCLKNLTYLSLEGNSLPAIQMDFQHLSKLAYLNLSRNPLESLPLNCFASKALQDVELVELGRLAEIDASARFSSELQSISLRDSVVTGLPDTLATDTKNKLTKLTVSGAAWWRPEGMNVNEVVKYESFENKFLPFLDRQDLKNIYLMYDADANGVLSSSEMNCINAHLYRYVPRLRPSATKVASSPRASVEPSNKKETDVSQQPALNSDFSGFPSTIFALVNLTELTLEYQGIKSVPDEIKSLQCLTIFNLNYCIELETLSPEVGLLPLKELNVTGCVSLKTPPAEIIRRGHTQTMAFLQRLVSGSTACKRTKLMLVGLGGAGKTSLVRAFLQSHSQTPPTVTDGIDILKWRVPLTSPEDYLEFSVWDFAGQSVYYHTHQFFLAKKAVYVLAWNIRLGAEHAGLDFWLSSICCHAPNAPIFVVGTHLDQVSRVDLRHDDFKRRYPQIAGFFNISTYTGDHVDELIETMIKTTLALPYMDEQIPKVWLNFEELIGKCKEDILEYKQVEDIAHNAGIFEATEVLQAVQFLHDLGSLQYFPSEHLKNYVVINPQWIVNVMACIVSIKDSPVKDGRLFHTDMNAIWMNYDVRLHPWILKLTEAFDLTFPVPDQNMNLVPCLLPEEEPEYSWVDDTSQTQMKEMKIVYTFNYLPAGLFNRAQVRLFQFSDKSTIWRYGSLLVKNNHRALIIRSDDRHILIKIQGIRPDNILFLIHEVFEGLVNESFFGVSYDIAFPCPDCLESRISEPWQFSSSLINRAIELKSPSIQCHRFFHVASVTDLQAMVPPDSNSNYDLHLEYSVRDLKSYKQNMAVDIVFIYPSAHVPTALDKDARIDPRRIKDDLIKHGLKVWTPESMDEFKIENHYLVVKGARSILFGISTELINRPEHQNLHMAFQTITNILRKSVVPVLFGSDMKWRESDIGVSLSDALYVNMQNPKRYEQKMKELIELIEQEKLGDKKGGELKNQPTDVFISYCWINSHDAVGKGTKGTPTSLGWGDPRGLKDYLESRGLSVWMDITRLGKSGVMQDIVHGLKNTKVVVACVSDEYTQSDVCRNEFLFAKNTLRLPVILAIVGSGDQWRQTEVGMCSLACTQVNFQLENPAAFEDVYNNIKSKLPKQTTSTRERIADVATAPAAEKKTTAAYQELFELTQRKFLRLAISFAETMSTRAYPRLFALDYRADGEESAQTRARIEAIAQLTKEQPQQEQTSAENDKRDLGAEQRRDEEVRQQEQEAAKTVTATRVETSDVRSRMQKIPNALCVRVLCENEENWHTAGYPFEINERVVVMNSASYLSRMMLLLKHSDLPLEILTTDEGEKELQRIADLAQSTNTEVKDAYAFLRRSIMECDEEEKYCGLQQCLMPSGKVLWLCEEHRNQPRVVPVTGSVASNYTRPQVEERSEMIKALGEINERIAANEIPAPTRSVARPPSPRRPATGRKAQGSLPSAGTSSRPGSSTKAPTENLFEVHQKSNENGVGSTQEKIVTRKHKHDSTVESTDCSMM